jgi:hypothetical protein
MSSDEIDDENYKTINKNKLENYKECHLSPESKNLIKCKKIGSYVLSMSIFYICFYF